MGAHSEITVEQAKAIKRDTKAKYEDRLRADGVLLQDYLPGVNLTPAFILERKVEDPQWLSSQFLYWLATHPHEAKRLDARKWKVNLFNWMKGDVYLPDLRPKLLDVQIIRALELLLLVQSGEEIPLLLDGWRHHPCITVLPDRARHRALTPKRATPSLLLHLRAALQHCLRRQTL